MMDKNSLSIEFSANGTWPGADVDVAWYVDQLDLSRRHIEAFLRTLRYGRSKGREVGKARVAFRKALAEKFHSLGDTCEFGFVQRQFAADPLDLFRFSSAPAGRIAAALDDKLVTFCDPQNLKLTFDGGYVGIYESGLPEVTVTVEPYGFRFHGGGLPIKVSFDEVKAAQSKRLNLLARKLLEDLEDAERIFVYKSVAATREEIDQLRAALCRFGPNMLLWVTQVESGKAAGSVEDLGDGLMRGYIDHFASENMKDLSKAVWLRICCEALRLSKRTLFVP